MRTLNVTQKEFSELLKIPRTDEEARLRYVAKLTRLDEKEFIYERIEVKVVEDVTERINGDERTYIAVQKIQICRQVRLTIFNGVVR